MNREISEEIISSLRELIPNPVCELNYSNNYELLCAVMLSAQTTDKRVNQISKELFEKYSNPSLMMNASFDDIYSIIKPLGFANNKANNLIELSKALHEKYNDIVPNSIEELMMLPGVGRKTASVVLSVGFKIPAMPVDTHVKRIAYRLGYAKKNDDVYLTELKLKRYIKESDWIDGHHLLLLFGRYYCKATAPKCEDCKLKKYCKEKRG